IDGLGNPLAPVWTALAGALVGHKAGLATCFFLLCACLYVGPTRSVVRKGAAMRSTLLKILRLFVTTPEPRAHHRAEQPLLNEQQIQTIYDAAQRWAA